jgi:hypothetical protein
MNKGYKLPGEVVDLGSCLADITKHSDGSYTSIFSGNSGPRLEFGKVDVGNRNMLTEVLSWFTDR